MPHGLLEAPKFIIVKPRTESRHWLIWHNDFGDDSAMLFDTGAAAGSRFGPNAPTSNVFGVYGGQGNRGTTDFVGYCWHDVPGLQKFGKFTSGSNGYVDLGFRPAMVMFKYQGTENWNIMDSTRDTINPMTKSIQPNLNGAEYTSEPGMDFLSNGFKCRGSFNTSGTYIYAAWAEAPSINLYGAQSNAR